MRTTARPSTPTTLHISPVAGAAPAPSRGGEGEVGVLGVEHPPAPLQAIMEHARMVRAIGALAGPGEPDRKVHND